MSLAQPLSILGSIIFVPWPLVMWYQVRKCEKPKHEVVRVLESTPATRSWYDRSPACELRRVTQTVVAEVEVPRKAGDGEPMREALSRGFRMVGSFIFGRNGGGGERDEAYLDGSAMGGGSGRKIAMTSPVVTRMPRAVDSSSPSPSSVTASNDGYVVAFVMPSEFKSASELPSPDNPNVKVRDVPSRLCAVLGWRGGPRPTEETVARKRRELDEILVKNGVRASEGATTTLNQYYPPFAPAWQRLCEISVDVDEATVGGGATAAS